MTSPLPTVQVFLDDGTGTFPYELTNLGGKSYARVGHQITRGRQDELSAVAVGQLQSLILDNTDGRFTPGSTIIASPSPIKADARIRVTVTANGTTVNRFTGYVQAWPVGWPTGGQTLSEVVLLASDAQARAERRILANPVAEEYAAGARAYYALNEPSDATSASDTSGNQAPQGVVIGPATPALKFGSQISPDGTIGVTFAGGQELYLPAAVTFPAWSAEFAYATTNGGPMDWAMFSTTGFPGGWAVSNLGGTDGLLHHFAVTCDAAGNVTQYVDGVSYTTFSNAGYANLLGAILGTSANPSSAYQGGMAHAFLHDRVLSASEIATRANLIRNGISGESGTSRINRVAGYAGLPVGTLDTSLTAVVYKDWTGSSAMSAIKDAADAEMGVAFIDGSGNLTFHNRNRVPLKTTPDVTIDADYLDPGTAFTTDMQGILNYFEPTSAATNTTQVVVDTTSQSAHGRFSGSATYLVATDSEAIDRGRWIVLTHKEPGPRAGTLVVDLLEMTAAQQAQLLTIDPDTWVQITGLPSQTPGGTTANLIVQGITDTLTREAWTLTLNVVDKATVYPPVFILDTSTLDSGDRVYL